MYSSPAPKPGAGGGPAHKDTLYGFDTAPDGKERQFERIHFADLKPDHLNRLKGDPDRNKSLRATLGAWMDRRAQRDAEKKAAGNDKEARKRIDEAMAADRPRMPKAGEDPADATGPEISGVIVGRQAAKSGIKVKRGEGKAHADLDSLIRTDVFTKDGKYHLVPIYAYQVATLDAPPDRAIVAARPELEWTLLDDSFDFLFSLYPGSFVRAVDRNGVVHQGYYRSLDRSNARVSYSPQWNYDSNAQDRFTTKTLASLQKFHVDRLGDLKEIRKEPRLWRGAAL